VVGVIAAVFLKPIALRTTVDLVEASDETPVARNEPQIPAEALSGPTPVKLSR
jgi:hypothetical protein